MTVTKTAEMTHIDVRPLLRAHHSDTHFGQQVIPASDRVGETGKQATPSHESVRVCQMRQTQQPQGYRQHERKPHIALPVLSWSCYASHPASITIAVTTGPV